VLLLPRGSWHTSSSIGGGFSIVLAIQSDTWFTLLKAWLGRALESDFREPAHGHVSDAGAGETRARLAALIARHDLPVDVDTLWETLRSRARGNRVR
jgi:hypothetical protein